MAAGSATRTHGRTTTNYTARGQHRLTPGGEPHSTCPDDLPFGRAVLCPRRKGCAPWEQMGAFQVGCSTCGPDKKVTLAQLEDLVIWEKQADGKPGGSVVFRHGKVMLYHRCRGVCFCALTRSCKRDGESRGETRHQLHASGGVTTRCVRAWRAPGSHQGAWNRAVRRAAKPTPALIIRKDQDALKHARCTREFACKRKNGQMIPVPTVGAPSSGALVLAATGTPSRRRPGSRGTS